MVGETKKYWIIQKLSKILVHYGAHRKQIQSVAASIGTHQRIPDPLYKWAGPCLLCNRLQATQKIKSCQVSTAFRQTSPEENKMLLSSCGMFLVTFITAYVLAPVSVGTQTSNHEFMLGGGMCLKM